MPSPVRPVRSRSGARLGGWPGAALLVLLSACGSTPPPGWLLVTAVTMHEAVVTGSGRAPRAVSCTGPDGASARAAITEPTGRVWRARVGGLTPATRYRCKVTRKQSSSRLVRFRTAPGADDTVTFAVVGDTGDDSPEATVLAWQLARNPPDFVLHVGDLAYPHATAAALQQRFFRIYRALLTRTVFYATPGNHDLSTASAFRPIFAQETLPRSPHDAQYAFDWGPLHLVAISSREVGPDADAERQWIAADLAQARERPWRIAFLHDPVYSPGSKYTVRGLRRTLVPILEAGRVDLLITGHEHLYARADASCVHDPAARMLQIVTGGGSADLDHADPGPAFPVVVSRTQYLRVRATPRTLDVKAIDLAGRIVDRFRLHRDRSGPCRRDGWPPSRVPRQ
ncbi:MAG: metallophosphoesterase [bacterium]|nr:metallophosphoesterase [bacterium]